METILTPIVIKKLTLKNRLVYPPMASSKATKDGLISNEIIEFYDNITKSKNIGLVIVEHSYISIEGKASPKQISIATDETIEPIKKLVKMLHKNETKAVLQINHAGSATTTKITGKVPVGASSIPNPRKGNIPKELNIEGISHIVKKFADSAKRAKLAGFDGVEIHSAHGYFLNQFLSPLSNKRKDEYGGTLKNRLKIHLEVVKAVREVVGEDYPIFLRLGASDYKNGGTTIEDSKIVSVELVKAGVDVLDISGGFCGYIPDQVNLKEQGYFHPLTSAIKEVVDIPVILTGGITDITHGNRLIKEKKSDLIGVGRAIFKDYHWSEREIKKIKN
ncbi:MAG: NADH:flavin oxidoreductase [Psychrilyobacter sp.]|uniref:NADH:flavin oxidoreductase n=1 Tax=Psychrilyobacter sp. TaxID=2586924 RepID=UPI003C70C35A